MLCIIQMADSLQNVQFQQEQTKLNVLFLVYLQENEGRVQHLITSLRSMAHGSSVEQCLVENDDCAQNQAMELTLLPQL
jgi:hypothetical protein